LYLPLNSWLDGGFPKEQTKWLYLTTSLRFSRKLRKEVSSTKILKQIENRLVLSVQSAALKGGQRNLGDLGIGD